MGKKKSYGKIIKVYDDKIEDLNVDGYIHMETPDVELLLALNEEDECAISISVRGAKRPEEQILLDKKQFALLGQMFAVATEYLFGENLEGVLEASDDVEISLSDNIREKVNL